MWILLLQEFDPIIKDRKGVENQVANRLSRIEKYGEEVVQELTKKAFLDEQLFIVMHSSPPWYANFVKLLSEWSGPTRFEHTVVEEVLP